MSININVVIRVLNFIMRLQNHKGHNLKDWSLINVVTTTIKRVSMSCFQNHIGNAVRTR
jgi:hypothetical protein